MLQKRRGGHNSTNLSIANANDKHVTSFNEDKSSEALCGPRFWSIMTLAVMSFLLVFCLQQFTEQTATTLVPPRALALSHFPTLSWALAHADLVGLYFAAQWCPMSTPLTDKLGQFFSEENGFILPPPTLDSDPSKQYAFAIVYISSDLSQEALDGYAKSNWISIPFNQEERTAVKKHFAVFAKRELDELDMERKFEIPTLMILDGATHGVITTAGATDVTNRGTASLEYWQELQSKLRAMEQRLRQ